MPFANIEDRKIYAQIRRQKRYEQGLCRDCPSPSLPNRNQCESCAAKNRKACLARSVRCKETERCATCGNFPKKNFANCSDCAATVKRNGEIKKAGGVCPRCKGKALPNRVYCRDCSLKYRTENKGFTEDERLKAVEALKTFDGRCQNPGCRSTSSNRDDREWCVDHDHATMRFRGILCHDCNRALGDVKDDIRVLEGLIHYLKMSVN